MNLTAMVLPLPSYWAQRDILMDKEVRLIGGNQDKIGTVKGVNRKGELLLKTQLGMESFNAGEISVRALD